MKSTKKIVESSRSTGTCPEMYFELELIPGKTNGLKEYKINRCAKYPNGSVDKKHSVVNASELRNLRKLLNDTAYMFDNTINVDPENDYSSLYTDD